MEDFTSALQHTVHRNLLKYSAGRAIFCPKCNKVADYRHWVVWTSPLGSTGAHCADCWRDALVLVHDDKPHSYLLSIGWEVNTLVDFEKPAKSPRIKPQGFPAKPGPLNTALRRDIFASFKRQGYTEKTDRVFPAEAYATRVDLIDTATCDGFDSSYSEPVYSSIEQSRDYAAEYCRLNHLTGS